MSDLYGYAGNNYTPGEDELQNGEIVIGLIVEKTLPRKYLNTYFKEVNEAKKNATLMGTEYVPKHANYKDGGIELTALIMFRSRENRTPDEITIEMKRNAKQEIEGIVLPDYPCWTKIFQQTPIQIYNSGFDSQQKGGSEKVDKNGNPFINKLLPSAQEATKWVNNKPVKLSDIDPDKEPELFDSLNIEERFRQEEWGKVLNGYKAMSEEQAAKALHEHLARRLLLVKDIDGKKIEYAMPAVGMLFQAKVKRKEGSKYFELIAFDWNKDETMWNIYSNLGVEVSTDLAALAPRLKQAIQDKIEQFKTDAPESEEEKMNIENLKKMAYLIDDTVPF